MKPTGMQPSTCYATSREQEATLYSRSHYTGPESLALKIYSDADWAGDKADCKSVSGYLGVLAGGPVFWSSKKQTCVATSSCKAELIALSRATEQALYMQPSTCYATSREQEATLYFTAEATILDQNLWHLKFIQMLIGQEIKLIANQSVTYPFATLHQLHVVV